MDIFVSFPAWRRALILLWENKIIFSLILALFIMYMANDSIKSSARTARAIVSFNYEESSRGLYPNGTRIDMNDFKSIEVLEKAIEYAGLTGEVSAQQLKNGLSISPVNTKSVNVYSSVFYVATAYNVSLSLSKPLAHLDTGDVLKFIYTAYSDMFFENYTENRSVLTVDIDPTDVEYYVLADMLANKASAFIDFIDMRLSANSIYSDSGVIAKFKDQKNLLMDFIHYDVEKYRAFVAKSGLAKNAHSFCQTLDYRNSILQLQYDKHTSAYNAYMEGIDMYNVSMSAIIMIPTRLESNEFYMSKSKSEIDFLADTAADKLANANVTNKEIEQNHLLINNIQTIPMTGAATQSANGMIVDMLKTLERIVFNIEENDKLYMSYKSRDYLTVRYIGATFSDIIELKSLAIYCGLLVCFTYAMIYLRQSTRADMNRRVDKRRRKSGAR